MKVIARTALVLVLAACSDQTIYVTADPGAPATDPDGGAVVDDAGNPVADSAPPASASFPKNLSVTDVAVFQGVKVMIVKGGSAATHNAPVVANRPGLVRVYATPGSGWSPHPVTAYLTMTSGSNTTNLKDTKTISGAWDETDGTTMFEFKAPAAAFQTDTQFSVQLLDTTATGGKSGSSPAQFPNDGTTTSLGVRSSGAQLKVYYFPIVTNGITPSTDATHIAQIKSTILSLYPVPDVVLTVQPALAYSAQAPQANGNAWSNLLNWFTKKRASDAPPNDVYYYGAFTPTASFASYCSSGCVAGLSSLAQNVMDSWARASIGLGYAGGMGATMETSFTAAHEIGHAHGRSHANCGGAQGIDPQFPYSSAGIGVWGYSIINGQFTNPSMGHDMMGYCPDYEWISDYTFNALFNRVAAVNGANMNIPAEQYQPRDYRLVQVDEAGGLSWGDSVTVRTPVYGDERTITYFAPDGHKLLTTKGFYYAYDHVPGGYMLVPIGPSEATKLEVTNVGLERVTSSLAK